MYEYVMLNKPDMNGKLLVNFLKKSQNTLDILMDV